MAEEKLTQEQAISVLIQGVKMAQNKGGVYTLEDAAVILKACEVFVQQKDPAAEAETPAVAEAVVEEVTETQG